jgi:hypothetical protein
VRGSRPDSEDGSAGAEQDAPAVAYVRMSTDHQKYSTENQLDVIRSYAAARGLQILRVFEDSGRSGLRLDGREALQNLMAEVQSGQADFKAILVYDVSRWGRFQDADEGAYHEHVCSRAGIRVSRYMFIWIVGLGSAIAFSHNAHIRINVVSQSGSWYVRKFAALCDLTITTAALLLFVYSGVLIAWRNRASSFYSVPELPAVLVYASLPVSAFAMLVFYLRYKLSSNSAAEN